MEVIENTPHQIDDAIVIGDLNRPEVDEFLNSEIQLIWAESQRAKGGKARAGEKPRTSFVQYTGAVGQFIRDGLSEHPATSAIDGVSFVYNRGKLFGGHRTVGKKSFPRAYRTATTAEAITALVIDVDEGDTVDRVVAELEKRDLMSVVYTSYSHTTKGGPGEDRFRIVVFLSEPYELPAEGDDRREAVNRWKRIYTGFCEGIGVTTFDSTGMDLARIQRPPRRPSEDAAFKHFIIAGTGLNVANVKEGDPKKYGRKEVAQRSHLSAVPSDDGGPAVLSDGFDVRAWFNDLGGYCMFGDVLDMLGWDTRTGGGEEREIMCPNDAAHTNAGDADDTACLMAESDDGFVITCRHAHCHDLCTWDMVRLVENATLEGVVALPDGYETLSDVLCDPTFYPDEVEGEPVELSKFDFGVEREIELTRISTKGAVKRAFKKLDSPCEAEIIALYAGVAWGGGKADTYSALDELTRENGFNGNDTRSFKKRGGELLKAHKAASAAKKREEEGESDTAVAIINQTDFHDLVVFADNKIKEANEANPSLFRYMEKLYAIRADGDRVFLRSVTKGQFAHHLNTVAHFARTSGEGDTKIGVPAPLDVVEHLYNADPGAYPALRGVVTSPIFARDGTLIDAAGYHEGSQLYYKPPASLDVPAVSSVPTRAEVQEAKRLLIEEVLADFPVGGDSRDELLTCIEGGENADLANLIAFILQPFMREMVDGPTPGHLLNKPAPGTGASLVTDVCSIIANGSPTPALALPPSKDEMAKTLTSVLSNGQNIVFFDNINHSVDSGELASAMTAPTYQARILGRSETSTVDVRCAWIFTGNGLRMSSELLRRMVLTTLDRGVERPEQAALEFRHKDIRGWATENRGDLVWACLTIIQNWVALGMVHQTETTLASYENWSGAVGGVLKAAEIGGFLGNRDVMANMDEDDDLGPLQMLLEELSDYEDGTPFAAVLSDANRRAKHGGRDVVELRDILLQLDGVLDDWVSDRDRTGEYTDGQRISRGFSTDLLGTGGTTKWHRTQNGSISFELAPKQRWGKTFVLRKRSADVVPMAEAA